MNYFRFLIKKLQIFMQNNIKNSNNEGGFFYLIEIILINYKILFTHLHILIISDFFKPRPLGI